MTKIKEYKGVIISVDSAGSFYADYKGERCKQDTLNGLEKQISRVIKQMDKKLNRLKVYKTAWSGGGDFKLVEITSVSSKPCSYGVTRDFWTTEIDKYKTREKASSDQLYKNCPELVKEIIELRAKRKELENKEKEIMKSFKYIEKDLLRELGYQEEENSP